MLVIASVAKQSAGWTGKIINHTTVMLSHSCKAFIVYRAKHLVSRYKSLDSCLRRYDKNRL
jgi:hypothetical protein